MIDAKLFYSDTVLSYGKKLDDESQLFILYIK